MAKAQYVGVNGVARKVTTEYVGVEGVARNVTNGYVGVNGVAREFFSSKILKPVSELEIGSFVSVPYIGFGYIPFIVVHQGLPSNLYDASCDGTWLLSYWSQGLSKWDSSFNRYSDSDIEGRSTIGSGNFPLKTVKIPVASNGTAGYVYSGSLGLETKYFLLSAREMGFPISTAPDDGSVLDYFADNGSYKKVCEGRGSDGTYQPVDWWLRSPYTKDDTSAHYITTTGSRATASVTLEKAIRPAMIVPSYALYEVYEDSSYAGRLLDLTEQ